MSNIKLCPKLVNQQEIKALMIGQGDCTVSYMLPCQKEKCIAYSDGYCNEYKAQSVEQKGE